jgi:hypothetical protein
MHGGNFCVAGWEAEHSRMARPLPNGSNWTAPLLRQHNVMPGATIDFFPNGQVHNSVYPHRTEDMIVDTARIQHVSDGPAISVGPQAPPACS